MRAIAQASWENPTELAEKSNVVYTFSRNLEFEQAASGSRIETRGFERGEKRTHVSPKTQAATPMSAPTTDPTQRVEPLETLPRLRLAEDMVHDVDDPPKENEREGGESQLEDVYESAGEFLEWSGTERKKPYS